VSNDDDIDTSEFHNEWYNHPIIEDAARAVVELMKLVTHPYVIPIWIFLLTYFIGGLNIIVCALMSVAAYLIGYKVWIQADKDAAKFEQKGEDETTTE
jgi:hypothetical protein